MAVPPNELFVLGDNRDESSDARAWGMVPVDLVKGRPAFVWWSRGPDGVIRWDRINRSVR